MHAPASLSRQQGAAVLTVAMILLFASSIAVFYLNRSLIVEQKTSANQMRSTMAYEMAEAGIEWATGMLNNPSKLVSSNNCSTESGTGSSFRTRYVQTTSSATISPGTEMPACKVSGSTLTCSCPAGGGTASLGTDVLAGFLVSFSAVAGDTTSVRVTSRGCTPLAGACTSANAASADATATVSVILKLRTTLMQVPDSALTCPGVCDLGGSYFAGNFTTVANGTTVNSGGTFNPADLTHLSAAPGMPLESTVADGDTSLQAIATADPTCTNSTLFKKYFGTTVEEYAAASDTWPVSCDTAPDCAAAMTEGLNKGYTSFYFRDTLKLTGGTWGTTLKPLTIVSGTTVPVEMSGGPVVNGFVFANNPNADAVGSGNSVVNGAWMNCQGFRSNGNGTMSYNADVMANIGGGNNRGRLVRLPGSWRDF